LNAFDIVNLTKRYANQEQPANQDITFSIENGIIFGLLGSNGAGKTTLVQQLVNLISPSSGKIYLFGKLLRQSDIFVAQSIGYMPQKGAALNQLTVEESLYFTAHLRGLSRQDSKLERERIIQLLQLDSYRKKIASNLSGGQRRLALLGIALVGKPQVLILDEPTNDLDPQNRHMVWECIRTTKQNGTTILLVTHNLVEAERVIERVAILQAGKLLHSGKPNELKTIIDQRLRLEISFDPQHPPILPLHSSVQEIMAGRWRALIPPESASNLLEQIQKSPYVEDFSLSTATLEDLYLTLTQKDS
jgi:ABC-2 type transport system ATP-binding protein